MDISGNSGSSQSSSGGDEEYDSRAESTPPFLNTPNHYGAMSNAQPLLFSQHQNDQANLFDLSSSYFHPFSQSQANPNSSSMLNLDGAQSRGLRSGVNCTDIGNLPASSSSSQTILAAHGLNQGSSPSSLQVRPVHSNGARATAQPNVVRNSKKRTRATRRAPTTVLTTDTSNFRAMVQEFTGIPSPPFSGSPYSRRLDLFGNSSALRSSNLESVGVLYPLRPSAQKAQPSVPFVSSPPSSSLLNNTVLSATNIAGSAANNNFDSILNNYHQLPSNLGLPRQPRNLLNVQSSILSFQSLPQPPLHPSINVSGFGAPSPGSLGIPSLEELGMSHGVHVDVNLRGVANHELAGSNIGSQGHLRSLDHGNRGNSARAGVCKLNYSAPSSSDFNHEKTLANASTRAEGTVDSWICPAD
ncbi:hypothetical protein CJ030_MR8G000762 [Morella rubra]|uniref:VQ domain-containing protein n=1 Tax=Morella rubra TaxID=262757 RepID=A0A6A1UVD9_9ROSI|nr:hypothetical protein CJ030_MR8G000762 [Morella rubra]